MSVTAIVPVWNGRELLVKLLATIARQTMKFDEVLLLDNGSTDGAAEAGEQWGARVIRLGENRGFAEAVNCGVRACETEHVAILNTDVELEPEWLLHLMLADADFATGKIVSAGDSRVLDGTYDLASRSGCSWRVGNGKRGEIPEGEIAMAPFTAVLFRRSVLVDLGLLDADFESYLEDVDFGLRCVAARVHGKYVPAAICRHVGSAALGRWNPETVRRIARNQIFLVAKYYPCTKDFIWPIFVGQGLWGLLAAKHGTGLAWLRGKWEGLRRFRSVERRPIPGLAESLEEQESEILHWQKTLGMDWFWRVYFGLTAAKRHRLGDV